MLPHVHAASPSSPISCKGDAGDTHGAVLHLLAARDIRPAIAIYTKAGMHREAAALATAKLLPGDPAAVAAQAAHGRALHDIGNFEASAAQYLAGGYPGSLLVSRNRHDANFLFPASVSILQGGLCLPETACKYTLAVSMILTPPPNWTGELKCLCTPPQVHTTYCSTVKARFCPRTTRNFCRR